MKFGGAQGSARRIPRDGGGLILHRFCRLLIDLVGGLVGFGGMWVGWWGWEWRRKWMRGAGMMEGSVLVVDCGLGKGGLGWMGWLK